MQKRKPSAKDIAFEKSAVSFAKRFGSRSRELKNWKSKTMRLRNN